MPVHRIERRALLLGIAEHLLIVAAVLVSAPLVPAGKLPFADMATGRIGLYGAALSFPVIVVSVLAGRGVASPNNYIPVIADPIYAAGLILLAASLGYGAVAGNHLPVVTDWIKDARDAAANAVL